METAKAARAPPNASSGSVYMLTLKADTAKMLSEMPAAGPRRGWGRPESRRWPETAPTPPGRRGSAPAEQACRGRSSGARAIRRRIRRPPRIPAESRHTRPLPPASAGAPPPGKRSSSWSTANSRPCSGRWPRRMPTGGGRAASAAERPLISGCGEAQPARAARQGSTAESRQPRAEPVATKAPAPAARTAIQVASGGASTRPRLTPIWLSALPRPRSAGRRN